MLKQLPLSLDHIIKKIAGSAAKLLNKIVKSLYHVYDLEQWAAMAGPRYRVYYELYLASYKPSSPHTLPRDVPDTPISGPNEVLALRPAGSIPGSLALM